MTNPIKILRTSTEVKNLMSAKLQERIRGKSGCHGLAQGQEGNGVNGGKRTLGTPKGQENYRGRPKNWEDEVDLHRKQWSLRYEFFR